ncbi:helix-turn-helix domain-containing protein [Acinetobacter wanghuae]|uniref:Helix-turn-helix domain-containing protein n=1 Tax=Acinetobacter wanghuae TaxID=2662362 RepID=A0A5Q0P2C5_9GAMM|nr:helix-turn-helix domain-containing protein [Acinetobacter wanghuae]MQW91107.1 helix-turn-helix domain-containing protein [Acinetobacter wanghuae]QGA11337.1 helix-turn-helix domain-containing protein [Acinetobacter wanghuae]
MLKNTSQKNLLLVSTNEAARLLCLRPQTLRKWAMDGSGPIQPIKIGNRLRWRFIDIEELCK